MKSSKLSTFILISCCFWWGSIDCFGQDESIDQSTVPMPPNAESFARYTEIPVSHYTGLPNISIPIYTVKHKDLELPIELSYHSAGNKNSDHGTWVGLGWTLQPGGMITKEIRDKDDFDPEHSFFRNPYPIPSSEDQQGMVYSDDVDGSCHINYGDPSMIAMIKEDFLGRDRSLSLYDWAPDIFTFNFNGITGKFMLNQDRNIQPKVIGESVVAEIEYAGNASYDGFIITTKDGNKYYFLEKGRTFYTSGNNRKSHDFSWSLNKIVSQKGDSIVLNYHKDKTQLTSVRGETKSYRERLNFRFASRWQTHSEYSARAVCYDDYYLDPGFHPVSSSRFTSSEPILESIVTSLTKVQFNVEKVDDQNASNEFYRLSSVEVFNNKDNTHISKNVLKYDNYYDSIHQEKGKLKLLSVQEEGKEPYSFDYYNNFSTKYGQGDHWGLYNGSESQDIPLIQHNYWDDDVGRMEDRTIYRGVNRETNPELLKAGIIKTITYPTGGKSHYEFEAHTFDNKLPDNSDPIVEETYHADGESEEETLFIEGEEYIYYNTQYVMVERIKMDFTDPDHWGDMDFLSNIYVSINGYKFQVFMDEVKHPIKYTFENDDGVVIRNVAIPVAVNRDIKVELHVPEGSSGVLDVDLKYDKRRYAGGLRIKQIEFDDGLGKKTNVKNFLYGEQILLNGKKSEGQSFGKLMIPPTYFYLYSNMWMGLTEQFYCQRLSLSNSSVYPQGGPVVSYDKVIVKQEGKGKEEYYFFNNMPTIYSLTEHPGFPTNFNFRNGNLDSLKTFSEEGKVLSKKKQTYVLKERTYDYGAAYVVDDVYKYLWDGGCPSNAAGFKVYPIHTEWNVLSTTQEYIYDKKGNSPVIAITEYHYDNPMHKNLTQTVNYGSKKDKTVSIVTYAEDYSNSSGFIGSLKNSFIHTAPIEQVTYHQNADGKVKIINGSIFEYNNKGKGELSKQFLLEGFPLEKQNFKFSNQASNDQLPFSSSGTSYQRDALYKEQAAYEYDQFSNVKTIEFTKKPTKHFIWGYDNTYPVAIVENTEYADIENKLGSGFAMESADGNYLNSEQTEALRSIPGALVDTYTFKPLVGIATQTDANGLTTYYHYDSNGRLSYIKDTEGNIIKSFSYNYKVR